MYEHLSELLMQLKLFRLLFRLLNAISSAVASRLAVAVFYSPRRFQAANWEKTGLALGKSETLHFDGETRRNRVGNEGPAVLLVHGWQGRRSQLVKIAVDLAEKGYRVITFDGPAHGSSAKNVQR